MVENTNPNLILECKDQVATIWPRLRHEMTPEQLEAAKHAPAAALALANLLGQLRADDGIRVIVLHRGGEGVASGVPTSSYESQEWQSHHSDPDNLWRTFNGIVRLHELIASIEKPIVAQVNGDVIGLGCSIVLACDLIVAREDAGFLDHHLGMGQSKPIGPPFGLVPGDGGLALAPLYFTPPLAKEFLMLAREYTAAELAQRGMINYAVPPADLDGKVAELVRRLLERPAYPLAWAKRVANRHVIDQLNRTLDAGAGYEMSGLLMLEKQGWIDRKSLD
ncbi:MAG TPA: enoyl-CoA hydratase/isomerase family protein [Chloroflexota bacterium]|nr:enoyl-CoA hydratase/isomerase family protein [Chloroflexota bacterium]